MKKLCYSTLLTSSLLLSFGQTYAQNHNHDSKVVKNHFELSSDSTSNKRSIPEITKLLPMTDQDIANRYFGYSVSLDGNRAAVGALGEEVSGMNTGAVYIFDLIDNNWIQTAVLVAEDGMSNDQFGRSVSLNGDTVLIGAAFDDDNGNLSGSTYVFDLTDSGWQQSAKLLADDGVAKDLFGYSVDLVDNVALIGAPGQVENGLDSGAAYLFTLSDQGEWSQVKKLLASDGDVGDAFGYSVSLSDNRALIGSIFDDHQVSESGAAYVYDNLDGQWQEMGKLMADDADAKDRFGFDVSLSGDQAIIGASGDDENTGAAYVYSLIEGEWKQQAKIQAEDGGFGDQFGTVDMSGNRAVIGAHSYSDKSSLEIGSTYVFEMTGGQWQQINKLSAEDGETQDWFGFSVSLSGDHVLVGAFRNDDQGRDSGSTYVFDINNNDVVFANGFENF